MPSEELKLKLFPPQAKAVVKAIELQRCPIIGTMGSGKTLVALSVWSAGKQDFTVILCGTNAIPTWIRQAKQWFGVEREDIGIAQGTPKQRHQVWRDYRKYQFVITTYQSFLRDLAYVPKGVNFIMDEYHKVLRSRTKTWKELKSVTRHSQLVLPVTGTPMRQGPQDMFPVLSICNPKDFSSYWEYVKVWCITMQTDYGQEILGPKNIENFRQHIYSHYCALMPKKETDKYLPKKTRIFVPILPSDNQRKLIHDIEHDATIAREDESILMIPNVMTRILRERQVLVSPKLIDPTFEYGTGIEMLGEMLQDIDVPRPVIFTDFSKAVPIIAEYMRKLFKNRDVWTLQGGEEQLHEKVEAFNRSEDDIIVVSLQYAQSFEFPRSQNGYVLGFNWSKDENEQAEDRLRRAISEYDNIKFFYFQYEDTIDGYQLERVREKSYYVTVSTPQ